MRRSRTVPTDEEESRRRGQPEYDLSRLTGDRSDDQKKTKLAAEADPVERAIFREVQKRLSIERLVFIDEFASHIAMTRTRARSPKASAQKRSSRSIAGRTFRLLPRWGCAGFGADDD